MLPAVLEFPWAEEESEIVSVEELKIPAAEGQSYLALLV